MLGLRCMQCAGLSGWGVQALEHMGSVVTVFRLTCHMWDLSFLTRDCTQVPCVGITKSYPLDHQGNPLVGFLIAPEQGACLVASKYFVCLTVNSFSCFPLPPGSLPVSFYLFGGQYPRQQLISRQQDLVVLLFSLFSSPKAPEDSQFTSRITLESSCFQLQTELPRVNTSISKPSYKWLGQKNTLMPIIPNSHSKQVYHLSDGQMPATERQVVQWPGSQILEKAYSNVSGDYITTYPRPWANYRVPNGNQNSDINNRISATELF